MCGLNFTMLPGIVDDMNKAISHRGIRSSSKEVDGAYLGHVRLPIVGLDKKFDQPYEYKGWTILFVGEIYNYEGLNNQAESDIEVLAEYWVKYGERAFSFFEGMWSAIFVKDRRAWVFIDPLGKKPLYYCGRGAELTISSEIKPLANLMSGYWDLKNLKEIFNPLYFSSIKKWGYPLSIETPYRGVYKLDPGVCLLIDLKTGEIGNPRGYPGGTIEVNKNKRLIRPAIEQAVFDRLDASDVPISLLLSGGLDSSIIYKIASNLTHNITCFHSNNGEEEFLNYLDIPSDIPVVKLENRVSALSEILYYNESPVDLGSMINQYQLAEGIKEKGFQVVLSGDGADELFGGYKRILEYDSQYSDIFQELVYYHLPRLDKLNMANTIELRCPFLSHRVIGMALGLSWEERKEKKFLKEIFSDIIPKEILNRKKKALKHPLVLEQGSLKWVRYLCDVFYELEKARCERADQNFTQ